MFIWERSALGIIYVVAISVAAYFKIRSNAQGGSVSRRDEGILFAITLRIAGAVLAITTLIYLAAPNLIAWSITEQPVWLKCTGVTTGAIGCLFMHWTLRTLGDNLTDTVVARKDATLITSGPYSYVRHPYYLAALLLMVSACMLSGCWLIAITSAVVWGMLAFRTKREEAFLEERFGDAYRNYTKRVSRFVPKLW